MVEKEETAESRADKDKNGGVSFCFCCCCLRLLMLLLLEVKGSWHSQLLAMGELLVEQLQAAVAGNKCSWLTRCGALRARDCSSAPHAVVWRRRAPARPGISHPTHLRRRPSP